VVVWKLTPAEMENLRVLSVSALYPNSLLVLEPGRWQREPWVIGQLDPPMVYQASAINIGRAFKLVLLLNQLPGSHTNSITGLSGMVDNGGGLLLEFPGEPPCWLAVSITQ
jgi:hypothetical protein